MLIVDHELFPVLKMSVIYLAYEFFFFSKNLILKFKPLLCLYKILKARYTFHNINA